LELREIDLSTIHFPRKEWRWLRPSIAYPKQPGLEPDAFLWAARVGQELWAWHPLGGDIDFKAWPTRSRVIILATDGSELEAFGLYLKTTFRARPGLDVEWVAAIQVLRERLNYDPAERGLPPHWDQALAACELSAHLGALATRARFTFLTQEELQLLFDKRWDPATLELLPAIPEKLRPLFVAAARRWNLSAAHAKECLNFVMILCKKLGEKAAQRLLENEFANPEEFRTTLFRTAQPELATLSQKRIETLRALKVPPRSSVFGDPSFESDILKITHTPRRITDFDMFKEWVNDPEVARLMKELLEIYQ
jgi:hypothetical protein